VIISDDALLDEACQLLASLLKGWPVRLSSYEQLRLFAALAGFRRRVPAQGPVKLHNRRALLAAMCAVAAFSEGLCRLDNGCGEHDCGDEWRRRCRETLKTALLMNRRCVVDGEITKCFENAICVITCLFGEAGDRLSASAAEPLKG
jgi:hypothetical protein